MSFCDSDIKTRQGVMQMDDEDVQFLIHETIQQCSTLLDQIRPQRHDKVKLEKIPHLKQMALIVRDKLIIATCDSFFKNHNTEKAEDLLLLCRAMYAQMEEENVFLFGLSPQQLIDRLPSF